ncbi:hypothetical protein RIEGSTA812A_PEG_262 [invertebrate metagenome]|uniref:Uncharacterized protein n=1 Tax=invertebrate metagenome TaxID=1711999 RepID=A0A484H4S5_9ZZZZ
MKTENTEDRSPHDSDLQTFDEITGPSTWRKLSPLFPAVAAASAHRR